MSFGRAPLLACYALLWMSACVLLGLTAYRVHSTKHARAGYEPIVVELMVASIFTILWVPVAAMMLSPFKNRASNTTSASTSTSRVSKPEMGGNLVHWLLFLAGAVTMTNRVLPGKNWCLPIGFGLFGGKQCQILTAILAFSWICWSMFTILLVLGLMHHSAASAYTERPFGREKVNPTAANTTV